MLIDGLDTYKKHYNILFTTPLDKFISVMVDMYYNVFINLEFKTNSHIKAKQELINAFANNDKSVLNPNEMLNNYIITLIKGSKIKKWGLPQTILEIGNVNNSEESFINLINWIQETKIYSNGDKFKYIK